MHLSKLSNKNNHSLLFIHNTTDKVDFLFTLFIRYNYMGSTQQAFPSTMFAKTFAEDKQQFFSYQKTSALAKKNLKEIAQRARSHDYGFLSTQRFPIEEEFRHLYRVLNDEERTQEKDTWLYCYYCCIMLSEYYKAHQYNSPEKYAEYLKTAETIEHYYTTGAFPKEKLRTWKEHLKADIDDLLSTPFHLSKLRGWLGFSNAYRIAFTFSRLTDQEFFLTLNKYANFLNNNLHIPFDLDEMNRKINAPTATFRALSVGLFASRFLINLSLVIKHTLFPTDGESTIPASARFYQEIKKRYPQLLNDLVWATINALTNYADFFKIPAPIATGLLITGLSFDFALLVYRLKDAERDHRNKLSQYMQEKQLIQSRLHQLLKSKTATKKELLILQQRLACIDAQIDEQRLKFYVLQNNFYANLAAATLIVSGFTLSMLVAAPAAVGACYLLIVIGTALYISADQYSEYREKSLRQERIILNGQTKGLTEAKQDTALAWNNFATSMIKNTVVPLLIMGTLAFSWQAALVLLVLFVTHEYASKYKKTDAAYKAQTLFTVREKTSAEDKMALKQESSNHPQPSSLVCMPA